MPDPLDAKLDKTGDGSAVTFTGTGGSSPITGQQVATDITRLNIMTPDYNPKSVEYGFGRVDHTDAQNRAAFQACVNDAAAAGVPVKLTGDYAIAPPAASSWSVYNLGATNAVHNGIIIPSGLQIYGRSATIVPKPPLDWTPANIERIGIFGTDHSTALGGGPKNCQFEDITFDFRDEFGAIWSNTYALILVGTDDFATRNLKFKCTNGTVRGRGLLGYNNRRRHDTGARYDGILQGHYVGYEYDLAIHDAGFRGATECFDFDGPCYDLSMSKLRFQDGSGSEKQCLDLSCVVRANISDIVAHGMKAIAFIYPKKYVPTYAKQLECMAFPDGYSTGWNAFLDAQIAAGTPQEGVNCEDITIGGVRATNIGGSVEEVFRVGNSRSNDDRLPVPRGIRLQDMDITNGNTILVKEGDVEIENTILRNFNPGAAEGAASIYMRDQAFGGSYLEARLRNVRLIDNARQGLAIAGARALSLDGVRVDNYGAGGFENIGVILSGMSKAVTANAIKGVHVEGGQANGIEISLSDTGTTTVIDLEGPLTLKSTASGVTKVRLVSNAGINMRSSRLVRLPTIDTTTATGTALSDFFVLHRATHETLKVSTLRLLFALALPAGNPNYQQAKFYKSRAGVQTLIVSSTINVDLAARSADTEVASGFTVTDATALIEPGDTLLVQFNRGGTGSKLPGMAVIFDGVSFLAA